MEKAREHQQPLYMCFMDFQKVFDSVPHDKLLITMLDMGYPAHLVDLLMNLYKKQFAKVRVAGTLSEWFRVRKGVRQGCVISPYLFNIIAEMVEGSFRGIHRRFADRRASNFQFEIR